MENGALKGRQRCEILACAESVKGTGAILGRVVFPGLLRMCLWEWATELVTHFNQSKHSSCCCYYQSPTREVHLGSSGRRLEEVARAGPGL